MEPDERPEVSVVIAVRDASANISDVLARLEQQVGIEQAEIIVARGIDGGTADDMPTALTRVRIVRLEAGTLPALKGAGIRAATGELIAILDPWDLPEPGWLNALRQAFTDPAVAAVAGAVALDNTAGAAEAAAYLFDLGAFSPPLAVGPTSGDLPGTNICYRRSVLHEMCADIVADGYWKPLLHDRIRASGGTLHRVDPGMRVVHRRPHRLPGFDISRLHHGRCFGAMRVSASPWPRKLLYVASAPLVPVLIAARNIQRARSQADNRRLLRRCLPQLLAICASWGVGEWVGCWLGRGRSCEQVY